MLPESDRPIHIDLILKSNSSELLKGLDIWLNLGLISEKTIEEIAQNHLSCLIPEPQPKPVTQNTIISLEQDILTKAEQETFINQSSDRTFETETPTYQSSDRT
ncbi:MAG: hypothetical protein ACFBSE_09070 [Prochloraceae cyanobacterium]